MTKLTVGFGNFTNATKMTDTVITSVLTFKTIRHVLGHKLVRVITSYTHTTLNWTLRISPRKRKRGQNEGKVFEPLSPVAGYFKGFSVFLGSAKQIFGEYLKGG